MYTDERNTVLSNIAKMGYNQHVSDQTFQDGHVGGCNIFGDPALEIVKTWKYFIEKFDIKSVLDLGCGFGFHTKTIRDLYGCKVLGVEGSKKVAECSLIPEEIVYHDYTSGILNCSNYDLCWCTEVVEHIEEKYVNNFIDTFKKCKYLMMSYGEPGQGGYHHVNEKPGIYWISLLQNNNFTFLEDETNHCRSLASQDFKDYFEWKKLGEKHNGFRGYSAQAKDIDRCRSDLQCDHFGKTGLIFKNNMF